MKKFINHKIFQLLSELSEQLQIQTFVVGGFVRDCLLEKKSEFKDIDIVCNKNAIELAKKMANKLNLKDIVIYKNFGTALVKYKLIQIEFISARKEYYDPVISKIEEAGLKLTKKEHATELDTTIFAKVYNHIFFRE